MSKCTDSNSLEELENYIVSFRCYLKYERTKG